MFGRLCRLLWLARVSSSSKKCVKKGIFSSFQSFNAVLR